MKLLISKTKLRRMKIGDLIKARDGLVAMHRAGDQREEVYLTHDAVVDEAARRMNGKKPRVPALVSRGAAKLMRIADVRARLEELGSAPSASWTEEHTNTIDILGEEIERRKSIARRRYEKYKAMKQALKEQPK